MVTSQSRDFLRGQVIDMNPFIDPHYFAAINFTQLAVPESLKDKRHFQQALRTHLHRNELTYATIGVDVVPFEGDWPIRDGKPVGAFMTDAGIHVRTDSLPQAHEDLKHPASYEVWHEGMEFRWDLSSAVVNRYGIPSSDWEQLKSHLTEDQARFFRRPEAQTLVAVANGIENNDAWVPLAVDQLIDSGYWDQSFDLPSAGYMRLQEDPSASPEETVQTLRTLGSRVGLLAHPESGGKALSVWLDLIGGPDELLGKITRIETFNSNGSLYDYAGPRPLELEDKLYELISE